MAYFTEQIVKSQQLNDILSSCSCVSYPNNFRHTEISPKRKCFGDFLCPGKEKSMFNNQRYVTKGITSTVPLVTQIILWDCIDSMKIERKDYLQVFKLVANGSNQQVTHIRRSQTTSELSHSQLMNQSQRKSSSLTMKHIPLCFWQKNID